ncbi:M20/M25/M40 family metallo-hydrolase [Thermaerobacter composti]|uniref:M20/M25/M40 family metallo-hydrolase n=1 Tax=Thermaerobacter composti TaxID=554949 RepID=A0ABZ0QM96_9FIRM|nr:M20/M25/M40 family metallo-hydrolase [Thermaerobacter composti]WPD18595.1 M20/M25/M40 family metallo-hydrolase [Thermaerobacter composti]
MRVLSEHIGPRPAGLPAERQAAEYIASILQQYGYEVSMQTFPTPDQYIGTVTLPDGTSWQMGASRFGAITGNNPVRGVVIDAGRGISPDEFPDDVRGKVVLMEYVASARNTQVANAAARGAAAVILYSTVGSRGNYGSAFSPSLSTSYGIPILGAALIQGQRLKDMIRQGGVEVSIETYAYTNLESVNVIGRRPARSGEGNAPIVVVSSHLDSVVGAPGANDDASGVGLALELARVLKSYNMDKELRFIFFGAEERGLIGSRYYVSQLSDDDARRIVAVFQADMVATSYPNVTHLYAMTVDGAPNIVTEAATAAGARLGNSSILPGQFGSSDHVPFHNRGIPAALFIWMRVDSWDPLVYDIEKVYHTPQDTIAENISQERMQTALEIIGAAVFDLARKTVPALDRAPHYRPRAGEASVAAAIR